MGTTQSGAKNGPQNGSEVLLDQLNAHGVDCIFASPIAVMAPTWEALTRRAYDKPRYFRCRHELLAVSLASGYHKATGRGQIVFLPTSLGVQNGSMGPHTALQERTPMTVLSPDTLTYGEDPSADPDPEWPSLLVDLVGPGATRKPSSNGPNAHARRPNWFTSCGAHALSPSRLRGARPCWRSLSTCWSAQAAARSRPESPPPPSSLPRNRSINRQSLI